MISATDMIEPADDRRHTPGKDSLPLWNESYWFPVYDPKVKIGMMTRIGILPNRNQANLCFFISHNRKIVHDATDFDCPIPTGDIDHLRVRNVTYRCIEPLRKWRLSYQGGDYAMDLLWEAFCPVYLYPTPPGSSVDQASRHIEQSGRATGTVTIAGEVYELDCLAHRDHSWGGERDWAKMTTWTYISGEFSERFSFNSVKIAFGPGQVFKIGFCWDGEHVMGLQDLEVDLETNAARSAQTGLSMWIRNEKGVRHEITGKVLDICPVTIGPTHFGDGFTRFRCGDQVGYGIIEYGYQRAGV